MSESIWFCAEHEAQGGLEKCRWRSGTNGPCRMVEAILVTSPDSIIIERENGEWPEEARSVLNKAIYQWFEDGRGVTVSFEADLALDSLAEWSQSPATDVATND